MMMEVLEDVQNVIQSAEVTQLSPAYCTRQSRVLESTLPTVVQGTTGEYSGPVNREASQWPFATFLSIRGYGQVKIAVIDTSYFTNKKPEGSVRNWNISLLRLLNPVQGDQTNNSYTTGN